MFLDFLSECKEVLRGLNRTAIDMFSLHNHFVRSSAVHQRLRQVFVYDRVQVIAPVLHLIRWPVGKGGKNKVTEST